MQQRDKIALAIGSCISLFALLTAAVVNWGGPHWELPGLESYPLNSNHEMFELQFQGIFLRSLSLLSNYWMVFGAIPLAACGLIRISQLGNSSKFALSLSRMAWVTVLSIPALFLYGVLSSLSTPTLLSGFEGRVLECWAGGARQALVAPFLLFPAMLAVPLVETLVACVQGARLSFNEDADSTSISAPDITDAPHCELMKQPGQQLDERLTVKQLRPAANEVVSL